MITVKVEYVGGPLCGMKDTLPAIAPAVINGPALNEGALLKGTGIRLTRNYRYEARPGNPAIFDYKGEE